MTTVQTATAKALPAIETAQAAPAAETQSKSLFSIGDLFASFDRLTQKVVDYVNLYVGPTDKLSQMTKEELTDRFGLTDLKILKNRGAIGTEKFDGIMQEAKEKFRSENDSLSFSQLLKKEQLYRLLDFFTFDELAAKCSAEFDAETDLSVIALTVGPKIFLDSKGRELLNYSRFESLGTIDTTDADGASQTFTFEKTRFAYESVKEVNDFSKTVRYSAEWS